ncbi:MAG: hypothetical protein WBV82_00595 [Myxococcaceae bacterium]
MRDQWVHFELARVFRGQRGWLVRIPTADGSVLEYRYPTRRAARYFAAIFRLKPTWYPPPHAVMHPVPVLASIAPPVAPLTPPASPPAEETLDPGASEFFAAVDAAFTEAF